MKSIKILENAKILTKDDIQKIFPDTDDSYRTFVARHALENGYDILYGENHTVNTFAVRIEDYGIWEGDIYRTALQLYHVDDVAIEIGPIIDRRSNPRAIYAAVRKKTD